MRIDKYLWAIRVFKTRTQASEACNSGKVRIGEAQVKSSRNIKEGDVIQVKKTPVMYSYRVKQILQKRVGAKLVDEYREDITPSEELEKIENANHTKFGVRNRGEGRPTKRDRRIIDELLMSD